VTRRLFVAIPFLALGVALAGCGGSSGPPTVTAAHQFELGDFKPAGPVAAGKPVTVSFKIVQPNGQTMTKFKRGSGPHTGVHMIFVRKDLSVIIHRHPPEGPNGVFTQQVTFPAPGPYRLVLDVYPATSNIQLRNFQLPAHIQVAGAYKPVPLPKPVRTETVDGFHFDLVKISTPTLHAIDPAFMTITVTNPQGKPAPFTPWFGALAHAIFFRVGSLDYFHTHVCSPGATTCGSVFGAAKVSGSSATPGHLTVGVLVPVPGTWRLFLQIQSGGKIVTAPFTLHVGSIPGG
jgi:hypothetical protein